MGQSIVTDDGIIRFYDGTIIAIEAQEYSHDGILNWEEIFNPNAHISTLDGVTNLEGHKYKRVKHSGDTSFQLPYKIVAETAEFRIQDNILEWKFENSDDTSWIQLLNIADITGEQGEQGLQGINGEGFHIDLYGYYQNRPDCSDTLSSICNSCNTSTTSSGQAITYMSLGDGTLVLTTALIAAGTVTVDSVAYTHFSNDLITWTILSGGIVDFEARYLATNVTGAVYTDMRTENYYNTQGIVYICAEGNWTILTNIATPSYMVGEATGSTNIGFVNNFVTTSANNLSGTIGLDTGKLEVIEQSINETALTQTTFGDGLETLTPMAKPQINASDFAGFGLSNYTSNTNSLDDIQVSINTLILDGLDSITAATVDGETRTQAFVNVSDLINNNSFLISGANPTPDTFNDLFVNIGLGLITDGGAPAAININTDDLSLIVDATNLRVKPFSTGNDGILATHLNPTVIYDNRGLALDTINGLYVRVDGTSIGFNGGNLEVLNEGITGVKFASNVVDNNKAMEISNDMLAVKIDNSSIVFDNGSLSVPASYITDLIGNSSVTQLSTGGTNIFGDIDISITNTDSYNIISLSATATHNATIDDTLLFTLDLNESVFDNKITSLVDIPLVFDRVSTIFTSSDSSIDIITATPNEIDIKIASTASVPIAGSTVTSVASSTSVGTSTNYAREDHVHNVADGALTIVKTTGLQDALNTKIEISEDIGNIAIETTGLIIDSGTNKYRLIVDANGNLDTELYT